MKDSHPVSIRSFGLAMPVFGQPSVEGGHGNNIIALAQLAEDGNQIGVSIDGQVELVSLIEFLQEAKSRLAPYMGMNLDQMVDEQQ